MMSVDPHRHSVSELNAVLASDGFARLVAKSEELHTSRIARIAELIAAHVPAVRLVLEAGPSAAGKTTTAIRCSGSSGKSPAAVSPIRSD